MGCVSLWHITKKWPNLMDMTKYEVSDAMIQAMHPLNEVNWGDMDGF